jgi:hypothetical protein
VVVGGVRDRVDVQGSDVALEHGEVHGLQPTAVG